jgi:hypothetical protein
MAWGLYFDEADLPALRRRFSEDARFRPLRDAMAARDGAAERRFLEADVRLNDHLDDLSRVAAIAQQRSFHALLTGDASSAGLARQALDTLGRFPRWDYFLEAGSLPIGLQRAPAALFATALALDWLGDSISPSERASYVNLLAERGAEPCLRTLAGMQHPDLVAGWSFDPASTYLDRRPGDRFDLARWPRILDRTNLKAVPASALALGAVVHRLTFGPGETVDRWLEQALFSLSAFRHQFAPDGSYDENVSYADYTALHLVLGIEILRRHASVDLANLVNWRGLSAFAIHLTMPTAADARRIVNFGDAGRSMFSAVPYWIARQTGDGLAQWYGDTRSMGPTEWSLVWHDDRVAPRPPAEGRALWKSDLDWIVARTGYDADALVVACRSGGPANHEHADRNSLVVKYAGEVLVADPLRTPYSRTDPAWILRTTAGHSAVLIDGEGHAYHDGREGTNPSAASARIVKWRDSDGLLQWTSDASPAYRLALPDVVSVVRHVGVFTEWPAIVVVDRVAKRTTPSTIEARFFADNGDGMGLVIPGTDRFDIVRPRATLSVRIVAPNEAKGGSGILPAEPDAPTHHPFGVVSTRSPALDAMLITVLLPRRADEADTKIDVEPFEPDHYRLTLRRDSSHAVHVIRNTASIPEFAIES